MEWWRAIKQRPRLVDAVCGVLLAAINLVATVRDHGWHPTDVAASLAAGVLLVSRRLAPLPVLALATAVQTIVVLNGRDEPSMVIAVGAAVYLVASLTDRRSAWTYAGIAALVLYIAAMFPLHGEWFHPRPLGMVAWIGMAAGLGDATRHRQAYIAAIEERARRAEQSRDEEARRRVAEERLRIARELHDVVAHHIAVINVQSGAVAHVLDRRPEAVAPALAHIRRASDTVLHELAAIVGLLRQSDDLEPTTPHPSMDQLPDLLESFAATGLRIDLHEQGTPRPLAALSALAAYRIVQEALTNARKHGDGASVRLCLCYAPDTLTIEVANTMTKTEISGEGYGLIGMRERAAAAGGTVEATPDDHGCFHVRATLPAREDNR